MDEEKPAADSLSDKKDSFDQANAEDQSGENTSEKKEGTIRSVRISLVEPNKDQPRKNFDDAALEELTESIKLYGVIQPLLVQQKDGFYEIIAGERRWRAAKKAGLKEIPVIVKDFTSKQAVEISLIENIQREDLNPIEEALAYDRLIYEFTLTQEEVSERVSKSRSAVTNSLRLLKLGDDVRQMVISGELSEGHARTILGIPDAGVQKKLADRIVKERLSVRETERIVKNMMAPVIPRERKRNYEKEAILNSLSEKLKSKLGTKVEIKENGRNKGKIEIEYYSDDELDRIFDLLQSIS